MNSILERIDHIQTLVRHHSNTDLGEVRQKLSELRDHVEVCINEQRQTQAEKSDGAGAQPPTRAKAKTAKRSAATATDPAAT